MPDTSRALSPFAIAFRETRLALHISQERAGALTRVARRTVNRWEMGLSLPGSVPRKRLIAWARTLQAPLGASLLASLGEIVPPAVPQIAAPAPVGPIRATWRAPDKPTLDAALYAVGEDFDIGVRTLRRAIDGVLAAFDERMPIGEARALLVAPRKERAGEG